MYYFVNFINLVFLLCTGAGSGSGEIETDDRGSERSIRTSSSVSGSLHRGTSPRAREKAE